MLKYFTANISPIGNYYKTYIRDHIQLTRALHKSYFSSVYEEVEVEKETKDKINIPNKRRRKEKKREKKQTREK